MRTNPLSQSLLAFLALVLLTTPLFAESPHQLREQMRPTWEALQNDIEYQTLKAQLRGNLQNREVVDRYLRYLPMSPMLELEIDMFVNRYEIVVPRLIAEWHQRWIELNELKARKMYGDAYVDGRLSQAWADDETGAGIPTKATVGTNRNAAATASPAPEDYQGEIQVMVNPNNANQIVAAANTWDDMGGSCGDYGLQAVFYSSDGGDTWGYSCPPDASAYSMSCSGGTFGSDPAVYWDDDGNVFLEYMLICYTGNYYYSIVVAKSTNGGASWSAQGVVINSFSSGNLEDKNFYAIDNNSSSSYYGRHYTCWDRNNNEKFAYSTNDGQSWTEVDLPTSSGSGTGSRYDLGCEIAVEDDGTVHVIFDTLSCISTCNNEEMFYTRSTNGGASWSTPVEVRDFNLVGFSNAHCPDAQDDRCIGPMGAIDVDNTGGSCDGYLYVTYGDYASDEDVNDTDVWVSRSTNDGASWSTPVKVNDDGLANRAQFHPFLWVDQSNGDVVVAWHDARNDSGNDAIDYYVARSTNCGLSFETNVQASAASSEFNNATISYSNVNSSDNANYNPNQYGEYMGLDVHNGTAYLAWADTRHFFPSYTTESQADNMGFVKVAFAPVVCTGDADCDDGLYCNGAETCNLGTNQCEPGTPVVCSDGVACTDDSCNEGTDSCDYVPNDANCDNGLFCDGAETCDAVLGCQAGSDPCPGEECEEVNDRCVGDCSLFKEPCTTDADCCEGLTCHPRRLWCR